jgi:hypothetical protein
MYEETQPNTVDSNRILEDLASRQFLRPHATVGEVLSAAAERLGFCRHAATRALRWLEIRPQQTIGRLRRTELIQLAQSVHRFWLHAAALEV